MPILNRFETAPPEAAVGGGPGRFPAPTWREESPVEAGHADAAYWDDVYSGDQEDSDD